MGRPSLVLKGATDHTLGQQIDNPGSSVFSSGNIYVPYQCLSEPLLAADQG
jgi:hypothetical protein